MIRKKISDEHRRAMFEELILAIVRMNPARLLTHAGCIEAPDIKPDDIIAVKLPGRGRNFSDVQFIFNEKSDAIDRLRLKLGFINNISKGICYSCIPAGFVHLATYGNIEKHILYLARKFLKSEAASILELKLNLVLEGKLTPSLSEAMSFL